MGLRISTKLFVISIGTAASVRITRNVSEHDAVTIMGHENQDATKNGIDENFSIEKQLSKRHKRQVWKDHYATHSGSSIVYYRFDSSINGSLKQAFVDATKLWETGTCLKFRESLTATEGILVTENFHENCYTDSDERNHIISLCEACSEVSDVAHEIGHALGLPHAQNRRDRDGHVIVNWSNIRSEYNAMALLEEFDPNNPPVTPEDHQKQYDKMEENDEAYYGIPYDLGSIMQYAPSNENATVIAKDKNYSRTMGSPFVSFTDKLLVNKHYNCSEFCREETAVQCANNGFLDPKDCNTCVCPKGFGGKSCEKRPDGCGQDVEARTEWQTINLTIYNRDNNGEYMECTVWILADPGKKIEVQIVGVSTGLDSTGCGKAGVEIKMKNDTRLTGYRFCSDEDNGISLKSNSNLVPVIMYSKVATPLDVILNYHSVSST